MCRKHCVLTGGFRLPTHGGDGSTNDSGSLSSSIRLNDPISPNDWNANTFGPMHALGVQQQQAASVTATKFRQQHEDDEIALAMRLSLAEPHSRPASQSSSTRPSLWLPMSITEAGHLRSLSPSPDLPEPSMLLPSSSHAFPSSSSSFFPHSASSSSRTFPTSSASLFHSPASSSSSSSFPPLSLAPGRAAALGATSKPKKTIEDDKTIERRLGRPQRHLFPGGLQHDLPYAKDHDDEPYRTFFLECAMSTWCVADTTGDLADLLGDHPNLDSYSSKFKTRGVECINFDDAVEKFFPTTTATAHLRHKLPAERTALCQLYKPGKKPKHRSVIVVDDMSSDSDEVEVITKKRPIKQEEGAAAPPPQQRPRLTLDFDTVITIDDDDSTPPLTAMSSSSSSTSTSTSTLNCLELNYT
ncbi:hypothetical protein K438DRAFT_1985617 [Mycena galopus ATCC 62051]|nr:hypothetical protein K438DRAFT_1985617 [Mycena galopus ATCC 62051]